MTNRIQYIDLAKGVAILLMILGHVESAPLSLHHAIYSFHMPLFFLLSGYFIKEGESVTTCAKKLAKSLLLPYMVVSAIARVVHIIDNAIHHLPFDWVDLLKLPLVLWKFDNGIVSAGAIWFLPVLFLAHIIYRICMKSKYGNAILMVLALISIELTRKTGYFLPFGIQQACVAAFYLAIGRMCKQFAIFDKEYGKSIPMLCALFLPVILTAAKLPLGMRANAYPNGFFTIVSSVYISIVFVLVLKYFEDKQLRFLNPLYKYLSWCGRFSLIILCLHSVYPKVEVIPCEWGAWIVHVLLYIAAISILAWMLLRVQIFRKLFNVK